MDLEIDVMGCIVSVTFFIVLRYLGQHQAENGRDCFEGRDSCND